MELAQFLPTRRLPRPLMSNSHVMFSMTDIDLIFKKFKNVLDGSSEFVAAPPSFPFVLMLDAQDFEIYQIIPGRPQPIGPFWGSNRHLGGVAQMESEFKTRKPNLATFGQIIYYISSRILKNHSVESRKDLIT